MQRVFFTFLLSLSYISLQAMPAYLPLSNTNIEIKEPSFDKKDLVLSESCPKYKEDIQITDISSPVKDVSLIDLSLIGSFSDDLDRESLLKALKTNIRYWSVKPQDYTVSLGKDKYSASHMLTTTKRLFDIFSQNESFDKIGEILKKEFKIYKAVSDDSYKNVTITGYYESEIEVTSEKTGSSIYPIYSTPADLVKAPAGLDFDYGRYDENGNLVKYYSSAQIYSGALNGKLLEIAYSAHPSQIMLAQIQGSSILRYKNGDYIRVGFASANGWKFNSVQKILMDCNEIPSMSFKDFIKYLSSQPQDREERLVTLNPRYIFFSVKNKETLPYGAMGQELIPQRSIAIDPKYIPLGITGYLKTRKPVANENGQLEGFKDFSRFVSAHDTGSAIRGPGRIDLFWGQGKKAETEASSMKAIGEFYIFVLK